MTINGDGSDALDFTYIHDLCQGIMLSMIKESKNEIFNITYGNGRKIEDLANIVLEHFPSIKIEYNKKDNLMPERGTLNINKAKQLLGYNPEYPIERGFENYIKWYKKFFGDNPQLLKEI